MEPSDVRNLVKKIISKITAQQAGIVKFDFTGGQQYAVSYVIQKMLTDRGFVSYVLLGGGDDKTDRLYIDTTRKRMVEKHE